jgi:hypothetical protein
MNDKIKKQLAEVSIEDLMALISEKKQATYQPLITEYEQTETKLNEIRLKIQAIDESWQPKTLADKIVEFVTEKGSKNVEEKTIVEKFQVIGASGYIRNTLKKISGEGGRLTVKEQKYSTVTK